MAGAGAEGGVSAGLAAVEEQVQQFLDEQVDTDMLQEAFNLHMVHAEDGDGGSQEAFEKWKDVLKRSQTEALSSATAAAELTPGQQQQLQHQVLEVSLRTLARAMSAQNNSSKMSKLSRLLEQSVAERAISARQACDALLFNEALTPEKQLLWTETFGLVRLIVGGVDYKGVREIMKACIEKVTALPTHLPARLDPASNPQVRVVHSLLSYIFDRNAALLPGYFIVNEILKSYPENPSWPHPSFVPLVSKFLNSFRPTAQMVSSLYRHRMRPIVEGTGKAHAVSVWKLDPNSLKFLLKGSMTYERILPYGRDIVEPQKELLRYVLKQPYSKEMINRMLGLQKPKKDADSSWTTVTQFPALCEELVHVYVEALIKTNRNPDESDEQIWGTLASQLIFFILFQYVSFAGFIDRLSNRLSALPRRLKSGHGRDWLMWAVFQYVSDAVARNPISDFSCLSDLFGTLYQEKEPLAVPDIKQPNSVRCLAAASILQMLHIRARQAASDDGPSSGGHQIRFLVPPALRSHSEYLRSLSSPRWDHAASVRSDYRVPVVLNTFSQLQDVVSPASSALYRAIGASSDVSETTVVPGGGVGGADTSLAQAATEPLSMELLDSLSVHTKISLVHNIINYITKHVASGAKAAVAPALVETYCRMLCYTEIESLGLMTFQNQLLPQVSTESKPLKNTFFF